MEIKKIMVIGAGQMGSGIAQVAATAGYEVYLNDLNDTFVNRGLGNIQKILSKDVSKGKIDETQKEAILKRLTSSTSLQDARDVDMVIEAAVGSMVRSGHGRYRKKNKCTERVYPLVRKTSAGMEVSMRSSNTRGGLVQVPVGEGCFRGE